MSLIGRHLGYVFMGSPFAAQPRAMFVFVMFSLVSLAPCRLTLAAPPPLRLGLRILWGLDPVGMQIVYICK